MSGPINNQVESLIRVTSRLSGVLDSEVEMLRAMQVNEIENLQEEKRDLTILYEETIRSLAAQPEALAALEPALRMELSDLAGRFDSALAENARALNALRNSRPSITGMFQSSKIASGIWTVQLSTACWPSAASLVSKPSSSNIFRATIRTTFESSTISQDFISQSSTVPAFPLGRNRGAPIIQQAVIIDHNQNAFCQAIDTLGKLVPGRIQRSRIAFKFISWQPKDFPNGINCQAIKLISPFNDHTHTIFAFRPVFDTKTPT
jgi:hypothetical protein